MFSPLTNTNNASFAAVDLATVVIRFSLSLSLSHPHYHNATQISPYSFFLFFYFTDLYRLYKLFRHCDILQVSLRSIVLSRTCSRVVYTLCKPLYAPFIYKKSSRNQAGNVNPSARLRVHKEDSRGIFYNFRDALLTAFGLYFISQDGPKWCLLMCIRCYIITDSL